MRDDVELSSWLLDAPLNTVIRQHPKLFCLPLYWTQRQWSILRVQILHYAHNAECQSTINLKPIARICLPKLPVHRVRQCIDQLSCSIWFRWPDQKIAAMRSLLAGWESEEHGDRLENTSRKASSFVWRPNFRLFSRYRNLLIQRRRRRMGARPR